VIDNRNGRATAMTLITALRPRRLLLQQLVFFLLRKVPLMTATLRRLAIVNIGWWAIIRRIPYNGPPQPPERLRTTYMLFESNFNGAWEPYIATFGWMIEDKVNAVWRSSCGFPGARPTTGAIDYVEGHQLPVDHFYAAYPEASCKMVLAALRLQERFETFQAEGANLDDERFEAAYRRFVGASQRDL
jgi:hypothetical protein